MSGSKSKLQISVIIPVYRLEARLNDCLEALRGQTLDPQNFEVIVVDNSPAGAAAMDACSLPADLPYAVRLLREMRPGSYAARNLGLSCARAELLAFTDDDCLPSPSWLAEALAFAKRDCILAGRIRVIARGPHANLFETYEKILGLRQREFVHRAGFGATANLIVARAIFRQVGDFDTRLMSSGDREWCTRAVAQGFEICYAATVVVRHPAMDSLRDLVRRQRRIAGGHIQLRKLGLLHRNDQRYPGFRKRRFYLGHLNLKSPRALGVFLIHYALRALYHLEILRCRWGGKPERL